MSEPKVQAMPKSNPDLERELTDDQQADVQRAFGALIQSKADWADARVQLDEATKRVTAANDGLKQYLDSLYAKYGLEGDWAVSPDGRKLIRRR